MKFVIFYWKYRILLHSKKYPTDPTDKGIQSAAGWWDAMLRQLIFSQQQEEEDDDGHGHADADVLGGQQVEGPPTLLRGRRSAAATQGTVCGIRWVLLIDTILWALSHTIFICGTHVTRNRPLVTRPVRRGPVGARAAGGGHLVRARGGGNHSRSRSADSTSFFSYASDFCASPLDGQAAQGLEGG